MFKAPDTVSKSERRELTQWKVPTVETVTNGEWFSDLDSYLLDQFPSRDGFRRIKSASQFYLFRQKENNKIVIKDGHAAEISYPHESCSGHRDYTFRILERWRNW